MPESGGASAYLGWTWEQMLANVLAEGKDGADGSSGTVLDRNGVAGPDVTWLRFVERTTVKIDKNVPLVVPRGDRELVGYRRIGADVEHNDFENTTTPTTDQDVYEVVRARVTFWDGGDKPAPSAAYTTFYQSSLGALMRLYGAANRTFDPRTFITAGSLLQQVEKWLLGADATLEVLRDEVGGSTSGLQGNAAEVFGTAVAKLRADVHQLATDMKAADAADAWSDRVSRTEQAMRQFEYNLFGAWRVFADHTFQWFNTFHPQALISAVSNVLDHFDQGRLNAVAVTIPDTYGTGGDSGTFDLTTAAGWSSLDSLLKKAWLRQVTGLDTAMRSALSTLVTALNTTARGINHVSAPPATGPGGGGGDGDGGGGGTGGSGGDVGGAGDVGGDVGGSGDVGGGGDASGGSSSVTGDGSAFTGGSGVISAAGVFGAGGFGDEAFTGGTETVVGGAGSALGGDGSVTGIADGLTGAGGFTGAGLSGGNFSGGGFSGGGSSEGGFSGGGFSGGGFSGGGDGPVTSIGSGAGGSLRPPAGTDADKPNGWAAGSGSGGDFGDWGDGQFPPVVAAGGSAVGDELAGLLGGWAAAGGGMSAGAALPGAGGLTSFGAAGSGLAGGAGAFGPSGAGALGAGGSSGLGPGALGGPAGMPPPLGGLGGANPGQDKERERKTWLTEDEQAWGTDPASRAAVIGRRDASRDGARRTGPATGPVPAAPGNPVEQTRAHGIR